MSTNGSSLPSNAPLIHLGAFLRTLIVPLMVWGIAVISITAAGQPGVVCVTPMAWLWALWSGGQYIRLSRGHPGRWPLLGPVLVGAGLGLGMGLLFTIVSTQAMPTGSDPSEVSKAQTLTAIMIVGGVLVCPALSAFTAALTWRRFTRLQQP